MGCCLPGASNPGITGNQGVWEEEATLFFFFFFRVRKVEVGVVGQTLPVPIGQSGRWPAGFCRPTAKQFLA